MKQFSDDLVSDRKFEVGGVVLEWRYPYWEELTELYDQGQAEMRNGDDGGVSTKESLDRVIHRVGFFLTQDSAAKWNEIVHRKEDPVPAFQIGEVFQWLVEVTSNRPTLSPSGSEPGGGNTGASSPDESPSTAETSSE